MSKALKKRKAEPTGPLAQRDELIRKRDAAYRAYANHTAERQRLEAGVGSLERRVRVDIDDEAADLDETAEELHGAQRELRSELAKANASLDRVKGWEAELQALYGREFPAFAEEADAVSKTAQVALDDFVTAYRRAHSLWKAAVEAWAPLCQSARIPGVPMFPLTDHMIREVLDGGATAMPPGIEIYGPDEDDDDDLDTELTD